MKRILAYIPDASFRDVRRQLEEFEVTIERAANGADLLERVITRGADAVLLWSSVPVLGRDALLPLLRSNPKIGSRPIFVVDEAAQAPQVGHSGEIALPTKFNRESLTRILKELGIRTDFDPEQTYGVGESYEQIPLTDFLTIIQQNRKTGRLMIESAETSGILYFQDGRVFRADLDNGLVFGKKAFVRLIDLPSSRIFFKETNNLPGESNLSGDIQALLLDTARIQDEVTRMRSELGDLRRFEVSFPAPEQLEGLDEEGRNLLLLFQYHEDIERALDFSTLDDDVLLRHLQDLIARQIVVEKHHDPEKFSPDEIRVRNAFQSLPFTRCVATLHSPSSDFVGQTYRFFDQLGLLDPASYFVPERAVGSIFVLRAQDKVLTLFCTDQETTYKRIVGERLEWVAHITRPEPADSGVTFNIGYVTGGRRFLRATWQKDQPAYFWRQVFEGM